MQPISIRNHTFFIQWHWLLPAFLLLAGAANGQSLSGKVLDKNSQEPLVGVTISTPNKKQGTVTGTDGSFSIKGLQSDTLLFSYLGYQTQVVNPKTLANPFTLYLVEQKKELKEAVVNANSATGATRFTAGVVSINPQEMRFIPGAAGEADALQSLTLMPGIKKSANGGEGFFVRGGSPDQNLFLIDDAPVYNPNHLLGFFSAFNTEAVSNVSVYKSAMPAYVGGRLSSVIKVKMKEGNHQNLNGNAAIGLLSTRVFLEGPLLAKNLSFAAGFRRSYIDQAFKLVGNSLPYYFYDGNLKLSWLASPQTKVTFTQFVGSDELKLQPAKQGENIDFGTTVSNYASSLKVAHQEGRHFITLIGTRTGYAYQVNARILENTFSLKSQLSDWIVRADYGYHINSQNQLRAGLEYTRHRFNPNQTRIFGNLNEILKQFQGPGLGSNEFAVYANHAYTHKRFNLDYGLRLGGSWGPNYFYLKPETRIMAGWLLNANNKVSAGFNENYQYMHLVSGSSAVMPTDLWFPVSASVKPQMVRQLSFTYEYITQKGNLSFTAEPYYKWMNNLVEYKEGTQILLNNAIEKDLIQGKGKAYGIELMLQQKTGKLRGWVSYTHSYSLRQFDALNNGNWFYARYDRRHDASISGIWEIKPGLNFSSVFSISNGMRVTPIVGRYAMPSGSYNELISVPVYGNRNSLQLSPVHRLDVNLTYAFKTEKCQWEASVGAYNVYNRNQAFKLTMVENEDGSIRFQQAGLYGFVPSASLQVKF